MGLRQMWFLVATLLVALRATQAQTRTTKGYREGNILNESLEDRIKKYSEWSKFASSEAHGRRLFTADSPVPAPVVVQHPDAESPGSVGRQHPDAESTAQVVVQPPNALSPRAALAPGSGFGTCKVLRWATGFANMTLYYDKIIPDTPNFGECCKLCEEDQLCQAWTRVAGGDAPNFRNCYLKYNLTALDEAPDRWIGNHVGHPGDDVNYPELRYVDEDFKSAATPVILESGTIPDLYPAEYYGCPYNPGNPTTPCEAPPTCNVDGNGVFVAPPCIE